jgi:monoamine oxidase
VGGRVWSMGGAFPGPVTFPGQVVERGGELIDTGHKAMLGYATEFNLAKENYLKDPGETFSVFDGVRSSEAQVVAELRDFTAIMRRDLQTLSAAPTFFSNTPADRALDQVSLAEYLHTRGAGPLLTKVLTAAYEAEYGLSAAEQSCFNLLYFIRVNNRSVFQPFGVSDERYHLIDGNEGVVRALAQRLPGQLRLGERLERARKTPAGQVELTFRVGSRSVTATYDAVVFALPFTVLRDVQLDANLGFSADKRRAIATLGYGTNAKLMVGFAGPYWAAQGCNGSTYSNLPNHQATWETNADRATTASAVLTDYSSAARGASLDPSRVQTEAQRFVTDLDRVLPGALANVRRTASSALLAHLEHWPSNPLSKGSYTCYRPGQFTQVAGLEGQTQGNCFFAGEHTNSFYVWQGYMEGAVLSGQDAATSILDAVKTGRL